MSSTHRVRSVFFVLALITCCRQVASFPEGAPEEACRTMIPGHSTIKPQTRPAPFTITTDQTVYVAGDSVKVTVKMNGGATFKGFMILSRRVDSNEADNRAIGSFKKIPGSKHICSQNGLTHTGGSPGSAQPKSEISFEWNSPASTSTPVNVQFRITIVVDFETFWVDERSPVVYDSRATQLPRTTLTTPRPFSADVTDGCGKVKGCYRNPPSCREETCDVVATWRETDNGKRIEFELSADSDGWVALGLSGDKKMGNDDVMECVWNKTKQAVDVRLSENRGKSNRVLPGIQHELSQIEWSHSKGRIRCQFIRLKRGNIFERYSHLLLAKGKVTDNGVKQRHSLETNKYPYVSPTTVQVPSSKADLSGTARYPLVKAHGCLMLIGWMMCASTALILSKYYKRMWPNRKLCGAPVWLAVHRALMLTALVCTVIAFILIFIHVGGYSQMPDYPDKAHPPLGICVTILVILNPILSIFRCGPDTTPPQKPSKYRPIYNWFHWLFGTVAYVLQMPAIFIGLSLHKAFVPSWATWVITAFVLFHLIIELLLEIHGCLNARKQQRRDDEDKPDFKGEFGKEEPVGYRFKKIILTLYVIVVIVLGLIMVIAVAAG